MIYRNFKGTEKATNKIQYRDWLESVKEWLSKMGIEHLISHLESNGNFLLYVMEKNPQTRTFTPQEWDTFWASYGAEFPTPYDTAKDIEECHYA